jgi:hypothetical protein
MELIDPELQVYPSRCHLAANSNPAEDCYENIQTAVSDHEKSASASTANQEGRDQLVAVDVDAGGWEVKTLLEGEPVLFSNYLTGRLVYSHRPDI